MKVITIRYFAMLREELGRDTETVQTEVTSASDLYDELQRRRRFSLGRQHLALAINDELAAWDQRLRDGDVVAFLPPVSGG